MTDKADSVDLGEAPGNSGRNVNTSTLFRFAYGGIFAACLLVYFLFLSHPDPVSGLLQCVFITFIFYMGIRFGRLRD